MANTRELSQLASIINIIDQSKSIGIITEYPNAKVGIGTLAPTSKVDVVGDVNVSGAITATSFYGDGSNLQGISAGFGPEDSINTTGIITASSFYGDGSNLTGLSGGDFATPLGNTSPLSSFYKVSKTLNIGAGISITVESDESSNNLAFIRELNIHVSTGSTLRIGSGTTLVTNVLNIF